MNKLCGSTMLERRDLQIHPFLEQLLNSHCILLFLQGRVCAPICLLSHVGLQTPWTVACQTPLSLEFPRQEYWSGLPFPTPGDLPNPGIKTMSLPSPALAGRFFTTATPEISYCREGSGNCICKGPDSLYIYYINSYTVCEVTQSCLTLQSHGLQPTKLLSPWNFPGKSTGVGCHFLLQGIFPTRGSNLGLLHCRQTLYCLSQVKQHIVQALGTIRQSPFQLLNPVIAPREQP